MTLEHDTSRDTDCPPEWVYSVYIDGELEPNETHAVDAHLVGCRACRELVVALSDEAGMLRAALRSEETAAVPRRELAAARSLAFTGSGAVAAALACVAVLGWLQNLPIPSPIEWLNPFELTGAFALIIDMATIFRDEAPAIYQFVFAGGTIISVAFLLTSCFTLTSRRFLRQTNALLLFLTGFSTLALVASTPALAVQFEFDTDATSIPAGEVVEETWVTSAKTVSIDGTLRGDLIAFGDRVEISGVLDGNLVTGARKVEIPGKVTGSIVTIAERVRIGGQIEQNAYAGASQLTLTESGTIGRDLIGVADGFRIAGKLGRDAVTGNSWIEVPGVIGRDLTTWAENAEISDSARIGGDLRIVFEGDSSEIEVDPGASIAGETNIEPIEHDFGHDNPLDRYRHGHFYGFFLVSLAAAFVTGMALFYFLPGLFSVKINSGSELARSLGYGFLTLLAVPVACIIAGLTMIGLPVAIIALITFVVSLYLAKIVVAGILGMSLLGVPEDDSWRGFGLPLLAGLGIVYVASAIPFIGGIISFLAVLTGLGVIVAQMQRRLRS